jgi:hypothetical protein
MLDGTDFATAYTMALIVAALVGGAGISWLVCWGNDENNSPMRPSL